MKRITQAFASHLARKHHYRGSPMEFLMGLNVEREHLKVVKGNWDLVAKIVENHLDEDPKYYSHGLQKGFFSRKEVGL